MSHPVLELYERFIINRAKSVLLVFGCLVILAIAQLPSFSLDASADSLLLEDDQDLAYYRELRLHYPSGDEFLLVTFSPNDGDVFTDNNLGIVGQLQTQLESLDMVSTTNSILNVPLLHNEKINLSNVAEHIQFLSDEDVDKDAARSEILSHPFYLEQLINAEASTTAIQIILEPNDELNYLVAERERLRDRLSIPGQMQAIEKLNLKIKQLNQAHVERTEQTIDQIRNLLQPFNEETFLGGVPMIVVDMVRFVERDITVFGGVVVFFLVLTLSLIFRQVGWVALALTACLTTSTLLTGFLSGIHFPITVISSNFIALIFIITLSMIIHLIVRYRELQAKYQIGGVFYMKKQPSHQELVLDTVRQMFWPCVYTSLTTIVAFMSLVVSRIRPVIDFGVMMSIGIGCAFLVSFLFFPALLKVFPVKAMQGPQEDKRAPMSLVFARITEGLGNWLYLIVGCLLAFSVFGLSILSVENRFIDYFKSSTEIHQGMKVIDRQLGGTTPLDVVIRFPELRAKAEAAADIEEDRDCFVEDCTEADVEPLLTLERLQLMAKVQSTLEGIHGIGKVLSIASTMEVLEIANKGPLNAVEIALLDKVFPDKFRSLLLEPYMDSERYEFRVAIRIVDSDPDLVRADLLNEVQRRLQSEVGLEPEQIRVAGMLQLYSNMLQSLFDSQIRTLGFVFIAILLMVAVLFRSIRLAFVALMPNILAGLFVLGLMGWFGVSLDIMTITIAAICVGMAVDNSIHYIYRFRDEFSRVEDYDKAMWRSHGSIGRALYYTSATIIVGFSILTLSSFNPTIYFGFFTSVAMCMALLGALTFLPRLMLTLKPLNRLIDHRE